MSRFANRSEINFVNSVVDAIFAEADRCDVDPHNVLFTVREALENKWRCVELARSSATHAVDLRQFYDPELVAAVVKPVNCRCFTEGAWGAQIVSQKSVSPQKIIYSGNRTIVFWDDDTKTIVKLGKGQEFDEYTGFIAAYAKKMFGSTNRLKKFIASISSHDKPKKPKKADKSDDTKA